MKGREKCDLKPSRDFLSSLSFFLSKEIAGSCLSLAVWKKSVSQHHPVSQVPEKGLNARPEILIYV